MGAPAARSSLMNRPSVTRIVASGPHRPFVGSGLLRSSIQKPPFAGCARDERFADICGSNSVGPVAQSRPSV